MILGSIDLVWQGLNYIHNNPVEEGFADKAEEYLYSSARDYFYDQPGIVPIKRIMGLRLKKDMNNKRKQRHEMPTHKTHASISRQWGD